MATFHIHQDPEKENAVHAVQDKVRNMQNAKDRRPTFAVLNNVPMGPRVQHGKATVRLQPDPLDGGGLFTCL